MARLREVSMQDLDAQENGAAVAINDLEGVKVHIGGTFVGTIKIQTSTDQGTTWVDFQSTTAAVLSNELPNCGRVRVICSAYTSGTAKVSLGGSERGL